MKKILTLPLLALGLSACEGGPTMVSEAGSPDRVITAQAAPSAPGEAAVQAARAACTEAIGRPGDLSRVEHMRPASGGAMVILQLRRGGDANRTERWRCGYDAATGRIVANNVT